MAQATTDKKSKPSSARHGIPCSPEELKESEKCWKDMEECFERLKKKK